MSDKKYSDAKFYFFFSLAFLIA